MYLPIRSSEETSPEETYASEKKDFSTPAKSKVFGHAFTVVLFLSLILNIAFATFFLRTEGGKKAPERSKYAGLTRTIPRPWLPDTAANETAQIILWNEESSYDKGNIALDDDYAKSMHLPRAQRFPWDTSKGIYLINAYHNLHCVSTLRTALVEFHNQSVQSSPWLHLVHCLNVLRDEIRCDADDTPRYTGFQPNQKSGLGQVRMCRDWKQLEAWADEHTACWRHVGDISEPGFSELDRYRFCPPGSEYEEISKTAGLDHDGVAA